MLKAQIKYECPGISETDLMLKCINFVKDQFQTSFQQKDDSYMTSAQDSEEADYVLAGKGQMPKDINSEDRDIQEAQMTEFWNSLNENLSKNKGRCHQ